MTTKEAFAQLISKRAWYRNLAINFGTGNAIASRFRTGELGTDKIEAILLKAGYKVVQEKQWELEGQETITSDINYMIDVPLPYYDTFEPWKALHSHMFSPETTYMDKMRMFDVYIKKLNGQAEQ